MVAKLRHLELPHAENRAADAGQVDTVLKEVQLEAVDPEEAHTGYAEVVVAGEHYSHMDMEEMATLLESAVEAEALETATVLTVAVPQEVEDLSKGVDVVAHR